VIKKALPHSFAGEVLFFTRFYVLITRYIESVESFFFVNLMRKSCQKKLCKENREEIFEEE
jgi:hypothetical protein